MAPIITAVIASGTRLGPYEIESPLGVGGVGEVYRARDTRLGRTVAIKVLAQVADGTERRRRLEVEARALSHLNHPGICTLYDIGSDEHAGAPLTYLVMELIDGETLESALKRGPLSWAQALTYGVQIAEALAAAHRAGIVHGDLKPGNIMVTKSGIKLLDFGLASERRQATTAPPDQVTRTMAIMPGPAVTGTLQYLAPEQIEGNASDERTDLFACGAVLYEMLAGRKAFEGQTPAAVISAILRQDPPPIASLHASVPARVDRVVGACLAKDPDARWQSAADLAQELRWVGSEGAAVARTAARHSWWSWTAAAVALLIGTAIGLAVRDYFRPATPAGPLTRTSVLLPEDLRFAPTGPLGGVGRFAISPDGRRLAFVAIDSSGNQRLWVRSLDALTAMPIPGTEGASSPFWSPDSRRVAFIAQGRLKAVDPSGGMPAVIASAAYNATGAWTDGTILFTPSASSPLAAISDTGGMPRLVTKLDPKSRDVIDRNPYFLPDRRHFLYVAVAAHEGGTTGPRAIYVGSLDDHDTPDPLIMNTGSIAKYSDGQLVFVRDNMLMAQPFDASRFVLSGEPRPIAEDVELTAPGSATFSLSTTGALVYQNAANDGSQLMWLDHEGHELGRVGEPAQYGDVELSPDGQQVADSILNPVSNTRDLWIVDVTRGIRTRLTNDRGDDVMPVWSPDGAEIVFASNRRGHFDLYRKRASGLGEAQLILGSNAEKYPNSWFGQSLLFRIFGAGVDGTRLDTLSMSGPSQPTTFLGPPATQGVFSPDGHAVMYTSPESGRQEVYVVPYPSPSSRLQLSDGGGSYPRWRHDGHEVFYASRDNRLMAVTLSGTPTDLHADQPRSLFEVRPGGRGAFYAVSPDGRFLVNAFRETGPGTSLTIVQNWRTPPAS
jgi:Tol biopolymer transport system component/predicted Ser/Thr protein kinase